MATFQDLVKYFNGMKRRLRNYKPIWDDVNKVIRDDFKDQLEHSKGPDGTAFKPLTEETKAAPRRSSRPYDTTTRAFWNELISPSGGTITKSKTKFSIEIESDAAYQANKDRPIGVSDKAADEIAEEIADYIVEVD